MYVAKTKALISFAVTAKLICVFVFTYAKCWFSHDAAHLFALMLVYVTYCKVTKFSDAIKLSSILPKIRKKRPNLW